MSMCVCSGWKEGLCAHAIAACDMSGDTAVAVAVAVDVNECCVPCV